MFCSLLVASIYRAQRIRLVLPYIILSHRSLTDIRSKAGPAAAAAAAASSNPFRYQTGRRLHADDKLALTL